MDSPLPQPLGDLLPKICPLILDGSKGVRQQVLKLFNSLPIDQIQDFAEKILPYIRAGMTHLAADIRLSSMDTLFWLLDVAGEQVVSCPGGFVKTMNSFISILNWQASGSAMGQTTFGKAGTEGKSKAKILQTLAKFLNVALVQGEDENSELHLVHTYPYWHMQQHSVPTKSNPYGYLNIWGQPRDGDSQMLEDTNERIMFFDSNFRTIVEAGVQQARREGGEIGRSVAGLVGTLKAAKTDSED